MDCTLVLNTGLHRRHLGDSFDERLQQRHQSFVVTGDNRFIISTGYWDKSFRVQNTDMAKTTQVLYGHFDLVTCVCRSEVTVAGNCFLATGSRDSTVCIWIWNGARGAIVDKEYPNQGKKRRTGQCQRMHRVVSFEQISIHRRQRFSPAMKLKSPACGYRQN